MNLAILTLPLVVAGTYAQTAPRTVDEAQRAIGQALDKAPFPVARSTPQVMGWFGARPSQGCVTTYSINKPAHFADGGQREAYNRDATLDWTRFVRADTDPRTGDIRLDRGRAIELFTLAPDRRDTFLAAANFLIKACAAPPAG